MEDAFNKWLFGQVLQKFRDVFEQISVVESTTEFQSWDVLRARNRVACRTDNVAATMSHGLPTGTLRADDVLASAGIRAFVVGTDASIIPQPWQKVFMCYIVLSEVPGNRGPDNHDGRGEHRQESRLLAFEFVAIANPTSWTREDLRRQIQQATPMVRIQIGERRGNRMARV